MYWKDEGLIFRIKDSGELGKETLILEKKEKILKRLNLSVFLYCEQWSAVCSSSSPLRCWVLFPSSSPLRCWERFIIFSHFRFCIGSSAKAIRTKKRVYPKDESMPKIKQPRKDFFSSGEQLAVAACPAIIHLPLPLLMGLISPTPTPSLRKTPALIPSSRKTSAPAPSSRKTPAPTPSSRKTSASAPSSRMTPAPVPSSRISDTSKGTVVKKDTNTSTTVKKIKKNKEEEVKKTEKKVPMLSNLAAIAATMSYQQAQPFNKKKK